MKSTPRPYTLKRRAEQQAATRRRIVEAAVELHGSIGPGRTSLSMVADRAGVQRHTLYAHFPEERDLFRACSALSLERDPLPDAALWQAIEDPEARLRMGLTAIYDWYARNAALVACVLRDAEYHDLTRETATLRFEPVMTAWHKTLSRDLTGTQQALLTIALSFYTWRTLTVAEGNAPTTIAALMSRVIWQALEGYPPVNAAEPAQCRA